jgi:hypothetical protein
MIEKDIKILESIIKQEGGCYEISCSKCPLQKFCPYHINFYTNKSYIWYNNEKYNIAKYNIAKKLLRKIKLKRILKNYDK